MLNLSKKWYGNAGMLVAVRYAAMGGWVMALLIISCNSKKNTQRESPIASAYLHVLNKHRTKHTNSDYVFVVDLNKPSSDYRFFVVRLKDSMIINRGLCCNGKTAANGKVLFSNTPGTHCSSKGAYRVGHSYLGKFGKAYKLHGLESTNSNAFARNIVLHAYWGIPRDPIGIGMIKSEGCPTVNKEFFTELESYIAESKQPVFLYILGD